MTTTVPGTAEDMDGTAGLKNLHSRVSGWHNKVTPFPDLLKDVTEQDALKSDQHIKREGLKLDSELRLDGVPLTDHALRQFAQAAGVPTGVVALAKLSEGLYRDHLAEILNSEMTKAGNRGDACFLRLRKQKSGEQVIRAVFDRVPVTFDAIDVLELLADRVTGLEKAIVPRYAGNGETYRISLFLPDNLMPGRDTKYGKGLQFLISEVGAGTRIQAFNYDHACANGMIGVHDTLTLKLHIKEGWVDRKLTGDAMQNGIQTLYQAGEDLLQKMGYTYEIPVPEPIKAIVLLTKDHRLTEEEGKAWVTGYIEEKVARNRPANALYTVLNGLNNGAKYVTQEDSREKMERLVAQILSPKRDSTPEDLNQTIEKINARAAKLKEADYLPYLWTASN